MEGTGDKVAGKARELKGKLTGNKQEEIEGQAQQQRGETEHKAAKTRRKVSGKVDELKGKIKQALP